MNNVKSLELVNNIEQSELLKRLSYDWLTGIFVWKKPAGTKTKIGDIAGTMSSTTGYVQIQIDGQLYRAHRLAFLYMRGYMPSEEVDHKNHVRHDNRWLNLRDVTHRENHLNESLSKNNTSGKTGVSWNKQGKNWRASIWIDGKCKNLGHFNDLNEAINAREKAEIDNKYHVNHGR